MPFEFLKGLGLEGVRKVHHNLEPAVLVEHALRRNEGVLADTGAFVVRTGKFTGRSPKDKYIVREPATQAQIWWGSVNQPLSEESFDRLFARVQAFLKGREVYVQELFGGADVRYRLPVRVVTQYAWHSLFAHQLFVRPNMFGEEAQRVPSRYTEGFTVIGVPGCLAVPAEDGTQTETFIAVHLTRRLILIGGTEYAGEIKKSIFTILNYLLPQSNFFPMHCSANVGREHGDTALFFGLSGTGKTSLSADPIRDLIGDDEHGWGEDGVYNFEGGCYAKCIRLSEEKEPEIWRALRFGTVLENVVLDPATRTADFANDSLTENSRAAYPIPYIPNALIPGVGGHPNHVLFLTADAFGVLPPISRLSLAQARFHFISGYTAKLAGTERGLGKEPQATFSACFGMPFLPLHPTRYAELLGKKLTQHNSTVWLVNTGWSGGAYAVGSRIEIQYTRAMVDAAIEGKLDNAEFVEEPFFGLQIPVEVPGVPSAILNPRNTWADPVAYDTQARHLARLFVENFNKYAEGASPEVLAVVPRV
jgi:phosphoenolpyruvate carboxykinase (ATP)